MHAYTLAFLSLTGAVAALRCSTFTTDITVMAPSYQPAFPPFKNHYESVAFLNAAGARNASTTPPFKGSKNITETFSISAEYCSPPQVRYSPMDVQVLTHGLCFNKSYWNFGDASSGYNYVEAAAKAGYATLAYDRIGNGGSSIVDPYTIQQAQIELAVLEALTIQLRNGTLDPCVPKPEGKVLHVGHSYGSILSHALAASTPSLSDGLILTGYSANATWEIEFLISTNFHLARENQPARFGNRSTGLLLQGDELSSQYIFMAYPYFDPAILTAAEAYKSPFSISEVLTGFAVPYNASAFTGPVLIITGDADLVFCGSDCEGILDQAAPLFPAAKTFQTYIQPRSGHGLNIHYNATGTFSVINKFLKEFV